MRWRGTVWIASILTFFLALPAVAAENATVVHPATDFDPMLLLPVLVAGLGTFMLWKWVLPLSLRDLQVAFEVDVDLYEVHRLTKSKKESQELLDLRGSSVGVLAYLMSMAGVMLIVSELMFKPSEYYEPLLILTAFLIAIPVFLSPIVTMYAQIEAMNKKMVTSKLSSQIIGYFGTAIAMLIAVGTTIFYGYEQAIVSDDYNSTMIKWLGYALLVFMAPTIFAYGRIMGASWNTLILSKWRTAKGWRTPIDPDKPSFRRRFISLCLFVFLGTMPLTAINGIVTLIHVYYNQPGGDETARLLDLGGIIGLSIFELVEANPFIQSIISLKTLSAVLASYLMLNVAIVGLAFIFELTRNIFLGGQTFGGVGGVILAQPRDIRTERKVQGRILFFGLAGFSGYVVLLLTLQTYKEFASLMPYGSDSIEATLLSATWQFITAGQSIFLLTWLLSSVRMQRLRALKFDLAPDERREGAIMAGGGDWMREHIEIAAKDRDIAALRSFQTENIEGDRAIVRLEKGRAKMVESALRGLWPRAIEEARKVLAQQGGEDDEARMVIAAGHIACRRIDAAKEALRGMEMSEGYDEPEILSFMTEWLDPWTGQVAPDDLYDWENVSAIDHLQDLQRRVKSWDPVSRIGSAHKDQLSLYAQLSSVGMMRGQRRSDEALDLALDMVRLHPNNTLARIACSLCLIDLGEWFDALDIFEEVNESSAEDPAVRALAGVLGFQCEPDELETAMIVGTREERARWIDEAPVNPYPALAHRRGTSSSVNANLLAFAHEAVERGMPPSYHQSSTLLILNMVILWPLYAVIGWIASEQTGNWVIGLMTGLGLLGLHILTRRLRRQQRRVIRHRDQKAMVAYAKMMRRYNVTGDEERMPIGNNLLMSGLLFTVNGNVYDIGMPGWLVVRLRKEKERPFRNRMRGRMREINSGKLARTKPLPDLWWTKKPKPMGKQMRTLERLIGPAAYRGVHRRKLSEGRQLRAGVQHERKPVMDTKPEARGIPTHSIRKEDGGQRLPSQRPAAVDEGRAQRDNIRQKGEKSSGPKRPSTRPRGRDEDDGH